ncbi:MAG TPA: hypothetical protein VLA26_06795 [Gammaproteobacteria bacterium]|nr:hypothetical protein [Gammaproteobacteria bacterium]
MTRVAQLAAAISFWYTNSFDFRASGDRLHGRQEKDRAVQGYGQKEDRCQEDRNQEDDRQEGARQENRDQKGTGQEGTG